MRLLLASAAIALAALAALAALPALLAEARPPAGGKDRRGGPPGHRAVPVGRPSCVPGAARAARAEQVRRILEAGDDVCVVKPVGDLDLSGLAGSPRSHVGTARGGSIGAIEMEDASSITLRARFRSIVIRRSNGITIEQSVVGGTRRHRVLDQLIFIPDTSHDVTIRENRIGWTTADDSGNTGYGIRAYRDSARLRIVRNRIHHIGADAIQLGMSGPDTLVDRNEISYVAQPPTSSEHSDDIQVTFNGPNMRITNNHLHHNGWWDARTRTGGSGPYIHAGTANALLFENNLIRDGRNFMAVGDLGTGGCRRSNLVFRRNTFVHNGTMWRRAPDLAWRLCGGSGNVFERNLVKQRFWNKYGFGASGTTARANLRGSGYRIARSGECTSRACNPKGEEPIGYREPSGVPW